MRLLRALLIAVTLAWPAGGRAEVPGETAAPALLAGAEPAVRQALAGLAGAPGREALALLLQPGQPGSRIDGALLGQLLGNPAFAPHARRALPQILELREVQGIDEVVRRMAASRDPERLEDIAFELHVASHLPVRELSAMRVIGGREVEVDAVLADGTLVEVKNPRLRATGRAGLPSSAYRQLAERAGGGQRVMLVVSRPLHEGSIARAREVLGAPGQLVLLRLGSSELVPLDPATRRLRPVHRLGARPVRRSAGARPVTPRRSRVSGGGSAIGHARVR